MRLVFDADKDEKYREKHQQEFEEGSEAGASQHSIRRDVYISPEEMEELKERYSHMIVQDFEDEYHMSHEERERIREQYSKFFQLKKYTKKIRKLDKFVEACRICLDIINDMAESNGIIDPEKFKKMALKGDIDIYGLKFPKFQGKNRKSINWDYVATYVMNPDKNIDELIKEKMVDEADAEDANFDDIYTDEYIENMLTYTEEELKEMNKDQFEESGSCGSVASPSTKKERKRLVKVAPGFIRVVKDMEKEQKGRATNAMVWQLDDDDMREIEEYDAKYNRKKYGDVPEFKGEATNSDDVESFLYQMDQWERENTMVEFNGRRITVEEMQDIEYKKMLEENGWNLRNIYGNKEREKRRKQASDDEKKRIKRLKKMLNSLQNKKDEEKIYDAYGNEIVDREEDKKKSKKIKKKKKKLKKGFDKLLLDVADAVDDEDIKGYKKRMEKMINGGD